MSKELVISAASHERRVAILEEGQLVEIYIEREKEFALVGSIYKGKVTRVLPGMQSAFVDIGLDGDAFLYVSDVFENLEDYDHGSRHRSRGPRLRRRCARRMAPRNTRRSAYRRVLPGESLAKARSRSCTADGFEGGDESIVEVSDDVPGSQSYSQPALREDVEERQPGNVHEHSAQESQPELEERQPESNASAPQNFAPSYNSTQNYSPEALMIARGRISAGRNDRGGQIAVDKIAGRPVETRRPIRTPWRTPTRWPSGCRSWRAEFAAVENMLRRRETGESSGPERGNIGRNDRGNDRGGQGRIARA